MAKIARSVRVALGMGAVSDVLRPIIDHGPRVAIVAGSGIAEAIPTERIVARLPAGLVPTLPIPSVAGHGADVAVIRVNGRAALMSMGRSHLYEGTSAEGVCAFVDLAITAGCTHLLLTNAVGGLHPLLNVGDLVLASDVMDMTNQRLQRPPSPRPTAVIDEQWTSAIAAHTLNQGIMLRRGVYVSVLGPSYETRAEIGMYRRIGADTIGMSTALEARYAAANGLTVCVVSIVTNVLHTVSKSTLQHQDVVEAGRQGAHQLWTTMKSAILTV